MSPVSFTELGEGLKDDFDGTIRNPRVLAYDADGKWDNPTIGVLLDIEPEDGDPTIENRFYGIGDPKYINVIDADGEVAEEGVTIDSIDENRTYRISKKSKFGMLLDRLREIGFPGTLLAKNSVAVLDGVSFHWKRDVLKKAADTGKKYDDDVLLPKKVNTKFGKQAEAPKAGAGAKKAAPAAAKTTKAKAAPPPAEDEDEAGDAASVAIELVKEVLSEAGESLTSKVLTTKVFQKVKGGDYDKATSQAIVGLVGQKDFLLEGSGEHWMYDADDKTVEALG